MAFPTLKRVGRDWLHWSFGSELHFGVHRHGLCWRLLSLPTITRYGNGVTWFAWWRLFVVVGCLLLMVVPAQADCRHFFYKQQVVAVQQQVIYPAVAISPYIYAAGRDIEADALAAKIAPQVAALVAQQLRAQTLTQPQAAPPPSQSAIAQHCASCHSGATPKAGIVFDGTTLLECRHVTAALRALASDKMPKDHKIDPADKGRLMQELLDLERKEELP